MPKDQNKHPSVLFIHEVGYQSKPIFEMHELPELLAGKGYRVGFLDFDEGENASRFPSVMQLSGRVFPNVQIEIFSGRLLGHGLISRLFSAMFSLFIIWRTVAVFRPDVIFNYSVPTFGWAVSVVARLRNLPIIHRAIDASPFLRPGWHSPFVATMEKVVFKHSTLISTHNSRLARYILESNSKVGPIRIDLPPLTMLSQAQSNFSLSRDELNLRDSDTVVIFMGTLFEFSGLDDVLTHMAINRITDFKLLIVGDGPHKRHLENLVRIHGLEEHVRLLGFQPFEKLPALFAISDIAINPFRKNLLTDCALPNKILQYMRADLPVVSTNLEGARSMLGKCLGISWVETIPELFDSLQRLKSYSVRSQASEEVMTTVNELFGSANQDLASSNFEELIHEVVRDKQRKT